MTCSARSFSSWRRSFSRSSSSSSVAPRHRVPAIGWVVAFPSRTVTRASGLDPTMSKGSPAAVCQPEEVHVGARVGRAQHPVDVERVGRAVGLEPLRDHDLERLARPDLLLGGLDGGVVLGRAASAQEVRLGRPVHRDRGRGRRGQLGGHPVEPGDGVVVGLVDPLVEASQLIALAISVMVPS